MRANEQLEDMPKIASAFPTHREMGSARKRRRAGIPAVNRALRPGMQRFYAAGISAPQLRRYRLSGRCS